MAVAISAGTRPIGTTGPTATSESSCKSVAIGSKRDGTKRSGDLWAWGEWEPESDLIRKLDRPRSSRNHPRYLWQPYYVPRDDYGGLHNTDPFIFGDCFLYSNCGQVGSSRRGLKHLDQGSVIAFGSGRKADGDKKWMLDTVLVVRESCDYNPLESHEALEFKVPDAFLKVTDGPLAADLAQNPEKGGFQLYRGATRDDPIYEMFSFFPAMPAGGDAGFPRPFISLQDESFNEKGGFQLYRGATRDDPIYEMFSFFPAMPAGGDAGFPRPFISLQDESFNPRSWQAPKGHGRDRTLKELRGLWKSLVIQVHDAGLVLGTCADVPLRRAHTGASNDLNPDGNRSTGQVPLRAPGCGRYAQP